jgi:hypothetical protein
MGTTTYCPNCGRKSGGTLCRGCGAVLRSTRCPECNVQLEPGMLYCSSCSHDLRTRRSSRLFWPLVATAAAAGIVIIVVALRMGPPSNANDQVTLLPMPGATDAPAASPREAADQFFDRAMRADASGDTTLARFAARMAIEAYRMLDVSDADTRLHIGLLSEITRDQEAVLAQADSIEMESPEHLFAPLLRAWVYEQRDDSAGIQAAYRQFQNRYQREMTMIRPEYEAHWPLVERFRDEARDNGGT